MATGSVQACSRTWESLTNLSFNPASFKLITEVGQGFLGFRFYGSVLQWSLTIHTVFTYLKVGVLWVESKPC